jgi:GTPase SAR1 family protein
MQMLQLLFLTSQTKPALKKQGDGNVLIKFRVNELLEKASSGIVIALCGNKVDTQDDRQVPFDVRK